MKKLKTTIILLSILLSPLTSSYQLVMPRTLYFIKTFSTADKVIPYFYYLKRLSESTYFLSLLCKKNYRYKPCNIIEQTECIQIDWIVFSDPTITSCIQTMLATQSLKPLLLLLREIQLYRQPFKNQFIHELFLLVFTVHKQILLHECKETSYTLKKTTLNTILEISEKINQLPIAEVLNAIDMLVTELPPFLEKYEFNSKMSWKAWLHKYWWVLPIFGGWFGLKILLSLQRPHYYFSPYLPRPSTPLQDVIITDPALLEIKNNQDLEIGH